MQITDGEMLQSCCLIKVQTPEQGIQDCLYSLDIIYFYLFPQSPFCSSLLFNSFNFISHTYILQHALVFLCFPLFSVFILQRLTHMLPPLKSFLIWNFWLLIQYSHNIFKFFLSMIFNIQV